MSINGSSRNKTLESRRWQCLDLVRSGCNFCDCSSFVLLTHENNLPIVQCRNCGLIYVNPRPCDSEIELFYRQYLRPEVSDLWKTATEKLFITDAERIGTYRTAGNLLDIGCGFGFFLDIMKERGWKASGCDLSDVAVRHAQEKLGLVDVKWGHFQHSGFPENHFDVVTLWYVLHHMSDPRKVLEKAHASLKKNGIIAIRLPNMELFRLLWFLKKFDCQALRSLIRAVRKETADPLVPYNILDPPVHLYAFSPNVITQFLEHTGFSVIRTYNDGMVSRGNIVNRAVDGAITRMADLIRRMTHSRVDLSISFSIYAIKV